MLYEVYASSEAFDAHLTGRSIQQMRRDTAGLQVSLNGVRCDLTGMSGFKSAPGRLKMLCLSMGID
jgi:hypothetical protein